MLDESKNEEGQSLLHVAALAGDVNTIEKLLKRGMNPFIIDSECWTARHRLLPGVHPSKAKKYQVIREKLTQGMEAAVASRHQGIPDFICQAMSLPHEDLKQFAQLNGVPNWWLGNLQTLQEKCISFYWSSVHT